MGGHDGGDRRRRKRWLIGLERLGPVPCRRCLSVEIFSEAGRVGAGVTLSNKVAWSCMMKANLCFVG